MRRIVCFHLYNDYSGSPKVLHMVLEALLRRGCSVDLVTSRGGVLDSLESPNLRRHSYSYRFSRRPALTMLRYAAVQLYTFLWALCRVFHRRETFYINTILPVLPALAGRLTGKRVVCHCHENADAKGAFYRVLSWCMQRLANEIICVSAYQASLLRRQRAVSVVPNALPQSFVARLRPDPHAAFLRRSILMLGSLKAYKGTPDFIRLAARLPQYRFVLVVNDTDDNIRAWLADNSLSVPDNLTLHSRRPDVAEFYNRASLVLNLSNPRLIVETFGLTAIEAMAAALPVIVPPVGGIAELVTDGVNGFRLDVNDPETIEKNIIKMLSDPKFYTSLAVNALAFSRNFTEKETIEKIMSVL